MTDTSKAACEALCERLDLMAAWKTRGGATPPKRAANQYETLTDASAHIAAQHVRIAALETENARLREAINPEEIGKAVADHCHGGRRPGTAMVRYETIRQAAVLGAKQAARRIASAQNPSCTTRQSGA